MSQQNVEVVRKLYESQGSEFFELLDLMSFGSTTPPRPRRRVPVEREFATLFTLVNGRIVRVQGFDTRAEALEAAGLRP